MICQSALTPGTSVPLIVGPVKVPPVKRDDASAALCDIPDIERRADGRVKPVDEAQSWVGKGTVMATSWRLAACISPRVAGATWADTSTSISASADAQRGLHSFRRLAASEDEPEVAVALGQRSQHMTGGMDIATLLTPGTAAALIGAAHLVQDAGTSYGQHEDTGCAVDDAHPAQRQSAGVSEDDVLERTHLVRMRRRCNADRL